MVVISDISECSQVYAHVCACVCVCVCVCVKGRERIAGRKKREKGRERRGERKRREREKGYMERINSPGDESTSVVCGERERIGMLERRSG